MRFEFGVVEIKDAAAAKGVLLAVTQHTGCMALCAVGESVKFNGWGAMKATTVCAAHSLPLMGVKGASVAPVFSYTKAPAGMADQLALYLRINCAF